MNRTKKCTRCKQTFPLTEEFFPFQNKKGKRVPKSNCRKCEVIRVNQYVSKHPDQIKAYKKQYYEKNALKISEKSRQDYEQWKEEDPVEYEKMCTQNRRAHLKNKYGITEAVFNLLLLKQCHKCAICGCVLKNDNSKKGRVVDHDHITGKVRGLLCRDCNRMLIAIETPEFVEKAQQYLHPIKDFAQKEKEFKELMEAW